MAEISSIFLVGVFAFVLLKGFRLDGFIYGTFTLNLFIDLLQFEEVAVLVLAVSSYLLVPIFGVVSLALMSLVSKQFWNWYIYQAVYNHYGYKF